MIQLEKLYIGKEVYGLFYQEDWERPYLRDRLRIEDIERMEKDGVDFDIFIIEMLSSRECFHEEKYRTIGVKLKNDENKRFSVCLNNIFETKEEVIDAKKELLLREKTKRIEEIKKIDLVISKLENA